MYILSNKKCTVLYIGVTSDLRKRVWQHQHGVGSDFTTKYNLQHLLYFEEHETVPEAIDREKQLKNWHREWKLNLIKQTNPEMKDLTSLLF